VVAVLLVAGVSSYWALDRYVIDHVEIADVNAYEAQVKGANVTTAAATAGSSSATACCTGTSAPARASPSTRTGP